MERAVAFHIGGAVERKVQANASPMPMMPKPTQIQNKTGHGEQEPRARRR